MMKNSARVFKEPSSSSISYFAGGAEARARFKLHCLLQDYQELHKETEEKKIRLKKILQKKVQLLAEVKFLRQKYEQFSTIKSAQFKLKKQQPHKLSSPSVCTTQPKNPAPLKIRSQKAKQTMAPTSTGLLDLNQVFLPTIEEMEGFEMQSKSQNVDWLKRSSKEDDTIFPFCLGSGNGSDRPAKRKVSWQDQLALRV